MLNSASVGFRRSMQKTVALSVKEAKHYETVMTVQDMQYDLHVLYFIGLRAHLPTLDI